MGDYGVSLELYEAVTQAGHIYSFTYDITSFDNKRPLEC